jgi:hypothetical protein
MKSQPWFTSRLSSRRSAASLLALVLIPSLSPVWAQDQAASPTASGPTPAAAPAAAPAAPDQSQASGSSASTGSEVVQLSPFEVNASQNQGYFSANTLAGTRLNNNIGDLASSITVVTKQQMEDTNSLDLNDVFRFEANTQGASTYTPYTLVRTNVSDVLAGGGSTSGNYVDAEDSGNRVRGLASVDNEEDNYFASSRLPFDAYNTDSVEIDRGPNSIIFGSGSPAGIVNQSRTQAVLDKFSGEADVEGGSWGGFRETADFNIPLIKDTLAIYVAQMYDSEGFEQKPSSDITRRQYLALTLNPFKSHKTKLQFSFENYSNYANDPNSLTPVDYVTPWLASGRPVWNPVTDEATYLNTGQTTVPLAIGTTYPNYTPGTIAGNNAVTSTTSANFIPGLGFFSSGHNIMFLDQGTLTNFFKGQPAAGYTQGYPGSIVVPGAATNPLTSAQALVNEERMSESTTLPTPTQYGSWSLPSVVSKNIYDWSTINVNSMGDTVTAGKTYHAELTQELLPNENWGSLNLDLGWYRQEIEQMIDVPVSQANATQIFVDTDTTLPWGSPNPFLGVPFIDAYQADLYEEPEINNNYRGMLEYEVNLADKVPNWLSWLGRQRFLGVYSQHDDVLTNLRYRPAIVSGDPNFLPTTTSLTAVNGYSYPASNSAIEQVYYMGQPGSAPDGRGTLSPGFLNRPPFYSPSPNTFGGSYLNGQSAALVSEYNYATGQWQQNNVNFASPLFATGGDSENIQDAKTYFWQSFFWNDRIVGSLGIDDDQVKNRQTVLPSAANATALEYPNGGFPTAASEALWFHESPWTYIGGNTSTQGVVIHPFKDWSFIDGPANSGNLAAAFLRTLSFTFNKSDNFNPPSANYTDFFGNPLGKPTGNEKDYGVEVATPDNKLFLRATWFTTSDLNQTTTFTSSGRAEYLDTNIKAWATAVVLIQNGENPSTDTNFENANEIAQLTPTEQTQISALTNVPYNFGGNVGTNGEYVNATSTENGVAKGQEIELTYNPTPTWTMKFTWGHQATTVSNADAQAQAYVTYRLPWWSSVTAPASLPGGPNTVYTLAGGTNTMYLGSFWQSYGAPGESPTGPGNTSGWYTAQAYYNAVEGSQLAIDEAVNGALAPNQIQYSWSYLTNYIVPTGILKGVGIGGAVNYQGRANASYYGSTTNLNASGQIAAPNLNEPIYTPSETHIDAWVSYQFKLPWSGLDTKVQFNVADLTSTGYLVPVSFNLDGSPAAERIIPPRQYTLEVSVRY